MRRGYTKQAYLDLVSQIRQKVPGVTFTSDFIFGFCGETEADHAETIDLIDRVKYNFLYMFAYSMREKTHAHHHLQDDVPQEVKVARVDEANRLFRRHALEKNESLIGTKQLVLVEGPSRRSEKDYAGRNDANVRVVFPYEAVSDANGNTVCPKAGDYLSVSIVSATSQSLRGQPLNLSSIGQFNKEVMQ
jgi:tRNA A37 methylthiotransferase MiaB